MPSDEELLQKARATEPVDIPIERLAPALKTARTIRGFSRRALSQASGIAEHLLVAFEAGAKVPTRGQLNAIWDVLSSDTPPPPTRSMEARRP